MPISTKDPYVHQFVDSKFEQVFRSLPKSKLIKDASEVIKQKTIVTYEPEHALTPSTINQQNEESNLGSEKKAKNKRIYNNLEKQTKRPTLAKNNDDPMSPSKAINVKEEKNSSFDSIHTKEAFTTPIRNPFDISQHQFMGSTTNLGTKITDVQPQTSPLNDINIFDDSNEPMVTKDSRDSSTFSSSARECKTNSEEPQFDGDSVSDELPLKENFARDKFDKKTSKTELRKLQTFGKLFMKEGKRRESPTL
ncbi:hypothetical protein SOMG_01014 [Schizosaccharomyces osmophilus]|uniref:Uncharacterized protein n=1 Tax=Schizosaccharomyces osmophilus TaxID=2545709 RepID=A0AAF0AUW8_9SCHI|nr:uncharacterized protein SOMG_01014 [Schizosaccharomyces osmophilus]WBW72032.1 hypothetical protein SOMG_01014 [Schizosaccharomyces osmophilus]